MKHYCTNSRPDARAGDREELERDMREFEARGGKVVVVPTTLRGPSDWHRAPLVNAAVDRGVDQSWNQKQAEKARKRKEKIDESPI